MRITEKLQQWAWTGFNALGASIYVPIKFYNNFRDTAAYYLEKISFVKKVKENVSQAAHAVANADDIREFLDGAALVVSHQLNKLTEFNYKKREVLQHSLLINTILATKAIAYFSLIRPALYLLDEGYKVQALDYAIMGHLLSNTLATGVKNLALVVALAKICSEETNANVYPNCSDHTSVKIVKANLASIAYFGANKFFLFGISCVPYAGPVVSRIGNIFVDGQSITELSVLNQCTEHRYEILKKKTPYSLGAGFVIHALSYILYRGIVATTGIESTILDQAIQNVCTIINTLSIYTNTECSGNYPYREIMYLPRRITALVMKESFNAAYHYIQCQQKTFQQEEKQTSMESEAEPEAEMEDEDFIIVNRVQILELHNQLAEIFSQLAKFFLGDDFSSLKNLMQVDAIHFAINQHKKEINNGIDTLKWAKGSTVIKFSIKWLDCLPQFCLPANLGSLNFELIGQVVYAEVLGKIVDILEKHFEMEFTKISGMRASAAIENYCQQPVSDRADSACSTGSEWVPVDGEKAATPAFRLKKFGIFSLFQQKNTASLQPENDGQFSVRYRKKT